MAKQTEQHFERDRKSCLLSLDFDEISEIFVEEEMIENFVQDCNDWFRLAPHRSS